MPASFHFLGAGSVGSLWAALFRQHSDAPITLILRQASYARRLLANAGGLSTEIVIERNKAKTVYRDFNVEWLSPVAETEETYQPPQKIREVDLKPAAESSTGRISSLIVATKAGAVLPGLQLLASRLDASSTIVLVQNGAGNYELLVDQLFRDRSTRPSFIIATTSHGLYRLPSADTIHTVWNSQGNVHFSVIPAKPISDTLPMKSLLDPNPLLDLTAETLPSLSEHLPETEVSKSLRSTVATLLKCNELQPVWLAAPAFRIKQLHKLVGNAVINPLTALMDVKNGSLLESEQSLQICSQVCQEAAAVFAAQSPPQPALSFHTLYESVINLAKTTAENISSTLADIRAQRSDTEIAYFNGYISHLGQQHNIATPTNDLLQRLVNLKTDMHEFRRPRRVGRSPRRTPSPKIAN